MRVCGEKISSEFKQPSDHGCNLSGIAQCDDKIPGNAGRCRWGEHRHDECLTENETEEVDFSGFDLVAAMKEAGIEVLCLMNATICEVNGGKR